MYNNKNVLCKKERLFLFMIINSIKVKNIYYINVEQIIN